MKRFVRDVAAAMLLFGAVGFAQAFVVVAPGETVAEKSQLELSQEWWRWALGAPDSGNPLLDEDGVFAQVGNNGPVFFVAGSISGEPTVRTFTVPAGRPIFFPVINNLFIETPPPECAGSVACALARVSPFIDDATATDPDPPLPYATLDGLNLLAAGVSGFRQTSSAFFSD